MESYQRREARNVKLLVIAMRVAEVLERGSKRHEPASKSYKSNRGIK